MPLIPAEGLVLLEGDRVKYTGTQTETFEGKEGTVTQGDADRSKVTFDNVKPPNGEPFNENLALRVPRYARGDRVRVTPRNGSYEKYAGLIGTVLDTDSDIKNAKPDEMIAGFSIVALRPDSGGDMLLFPISDVSLLTFLDDLAPRFEVFDVVRVGTQVCVVRTAPDAPDGLYEVEDPAGETLYVSAASMEKLT